MTSPSAPRTERAWGWRRWLPALLITAALALVFVRITQGIAT